MQKKLLPIIITLAILSVIGLTASADVYNLVMNGGKLNSKFWKGRGGKQLTKWTEAVKSGKTPNFGPRLF